MERAIKSVLDQSVDSYELIVVDDGSTDDETIGILKRYEDVEAVHVFRKENGGVSSARNLGMKKACGKYIIFLDGDDYLDKNACEKYQEIILKNGMVDVLVANYMIDDEMMGRSTTVDHINDEVVYRNDSEKAVCTVYQKNIFNNRGCYRRESIRANKLTMREDLSVLEDIDFALNAMLNAEVIVITSVSVYHYCIYMEDGNEHGIVTLRRFKDQIRASSDWILELNSGQYSEELRIQMSRLFSDNLCVYYLLLPQMETKERSEAYSIGKAQIDLLKFGNVKCKSVYRFIRCFGIRFTVFFLGGIYSMKHRIAA